VAVTRTFSKSYSLAGMRLGLAVARPEMVAALDKIRDHYHLDRLHWLQRPLPCMIRRICGRPCTDPRHARTFAPSWPPSVTRSSLAGQLRLLLPPDRDGKRVYEALYARKISGALLRRPAARPRPAHHHRHGAEMAATLAALKEIG